MPLFVGGIVIGRLGLDDDLEAFDLTGSGTAGETAVTDGGTRACSGGCETPRTRPHLQRFLTAARCAWSSLVDTLPYLVFGMVVGALVHGAVPVRVVQGLLAPEDPLTVPFAALGA